MNAQRPRRRRRAPRLEVVQNGRTLAKDEAAAVLAIVNARFAATQEQRGRLQRRLDRVQGPPEHTGIARAMILVEARLAKALWAIAQQTSGSPLKPTQSSTHGISYLYESVDNFARYSDAPAGDWKSAMPPPSRPIPTSKEIDAAAEAQSWLLFVDEEDRKLLVVGATAKRGDAGRNINWKRIKDGRPELNDIPIRTLQCRYQNGLRSIVLGLALARAA